MLAPISPTDYHDHDDDDLHGNVDDSDGTTIMVLVSMMIMITRMLIIIKVVIKPMFPGNEFMVDKNSDHQRGWGAK